MILGPKQQLSPSPHCRRCMASTKFSLVHSWSSKQRRCLKSSGYLGHASFFPCTTFHLPCEVHNQVKRDHKLTSCEIWTIFYTVDRNFNIIRHTRYSYGYYELESFIGRGIGLITHLTFITSRSAPALSQTLCNHRHNVSSCPSIRSLSEDINSNSSWRCDIKNTHFVHSRHITIFAPAYSQKIGQIW